MHRARIWSLVADGARAFVLTGIGDPDGGETTAFHAEHAPARELGSDAPGSTFASYGRRRSRMEPASDAVRLHERAFAGTLIEYLESALRRDQFDRLIIIAETRTLGHLRDVLAPQLADRLIFETAKDLTGQSGMKMRSAVETMLSSHARVV